MSDKTPPSRSQFQHWCQEICRYGDTDRQGHVNNAVFATYFETGRVMYLRARDGSLVPKGYEVVLARQAINFRKELQWGDVVDIGTAVVRLGNASFTTLQGLYRGEDCVASAESVLVLMDATTRKPAILPEELRQKFT